MPRSVVEWVGKNEDTPIPPRVKVRVIVLHNGQCHICKRSSDRFVGYVFDHKVALINGGENRESNLQPLCKPCHALKTGKDVAEKSKIAKIRKKHLGLAKPKRKIPSRPFNRRT